MQHYSHVVILDLENSRESIRLVFYGIHWMRFLFYTEQRAPPRDTFLAGAHRSRMLSPVILTRCTPHSETSSSKVAAASLPASTFSSRTAPPPLYIQQQ
ncbi:hypothetical protein BDY19DRAFT_418924 [Irpex rosettiformis]|uniref:Uncharacterized protein n=1 Tax=Irpex rosettiformis TaxID=378272 RepID=A0ACB8UGV6_9APHY|nr:hypothetical protein BDY19DRAFT_418924 [Irpex rosettiformis]